MPWTSPGDAMQGGEIVGDELRLEQQVLGGIADERQFRKHHQPGPLVAGMARNSRILRRLPTRSPTVLFIWAKAIRMGGKLYTGGDHSAVASRSAAKLLMAERVALAYTCGEFVGPGFVSGSVSCDRRTISNGVTRPATGPGTTGTTALGDRVAHWRWRQRSLPSNCRR